MFKHCYLSLFLIITFLVTTHAQIMLTGKVTDVNCEPLEYVEVSANGVAVGATTDSLGNYQLWLPNDSTRLITCRYLTYEATKVFYGKQKVVNIKFPNTQSFMLAVLGIRETPKTMQLGATKLLNSNELNQGAIDNPLQLIQGKVEGLDIQRIEGDPNAPLTMRLRGLNSVNQVHKPLIIIDNVPNMSLESVHPDDIESIEIWKDGKFCDFGLDAMGGAIAIQTKKANKNLFGRSRTINYKQNVSFDFLANRLKSLDASEFVALGGQNFNANTDWIQAITRVGFAQRHHLSMVQQGKNYNIQGALHYRNVNGIVINNDFKEYGYRINGDYAAFNRKLTLSYIIAQNKYQRNLDFDEVFEFATAFNPTIPKYLPDGTHQEVRSGLPNPLAMIEQHWNRKMDSYQTLQAEAHYQFYNYFKINILANHSKDAIEAGEYSPKISWYKNPDGNGYGVQQMEENSQVFIHGSLDYQQSWGKQTLAATIGSRAKKNESNINNFEKTDFAQDVSTITALQSGRRLFSSVKSRFSTGSNTIYSQFKYDYNNQVTTSLGISKTNILLGNSSIQEVWSPQWNANWLIINNNAFLNELRLRVGAGRSSNLSPLFNFLPLPPEVKTELNAAIDFKSSNQRLLGSLSFFKNEIKSVLFMLAPMVLNGVPQVTTNSILQNNGIELDLTYKILKNKPLKWETNLQMSIIKTQKIGPITTLGFGGRPLITDNIGEPLGQITVFRAGDIVNGTMRGRDINGDGRLNNEDVVIAGQGLPAFVLNGSNQLIYKQLGLSIVGRGAFGHSLLNMYRRVFETFGTTTLTFSNQIRTTKANPKVSNRTFLTDDLVENASFFTLEHIALSYTMNSFPCHYKWRPHFVKILLTAHHLWTFTNYTGVSPEVRYEAVDKTKRFTQYALTPGVESLYSYFPARSFSLGLEIHF